MTDVHRFRRLRPLVPLLLCIAGSLAFAQGRPAPRNGDFIVAVVNQELVTAGEIDQRLARAREGAARRRWPRMDRECNR